MKRWITLSVRRTLAVVTSLTTILLTVSPATSLAQRNKDDKEEKKPRRSEEKTPPPPDNPLVLNNPVNGSGNATDQFNEKGQRKDNREKDETDLGNFRKNPDDPRLAKKDPKDLPFFGYNFFEPARNFILARRSYYQRMYGVEPTNSLRDSRNARKRNGNLEEDTNDDTQDNSKLPNGRTRDDQRNNTGKRQNGNRTEDDDTTYIPLPGGKRGKPLPGEAEPPEKKNDRTRSTQDEDGNTTNTKDRNASARDKQGRDTEEDRSQTGRKNGTRTDQEDDRTNNRDKNDPDYLNQSNRNRLPSSAEEANSIRRRQNELDSDPVNAFKEAADPFSQLFRNVMASVPDNYQLSAGDKVSVRYQSPTLAEREFSGTVDALGNLNIDNLTRVVVRGLTLDAAQKLLQSKLRSFYKNVEVTLNLKELRTISVTVAGEAFNPITYTVPSIFTAFNLLYLSGGPTDNGSLRRIEVRRQGRLVGMLDFYHIMRGSNPNVKTQGDIPLQSGDIVYIPPRESQVAVYGEVRTPAIYELIEGETLSDALRYTGGIKASGVKQSVQINTVDPGRTRVLKNVDIKNTADADKYPLYDGDTVDVFSVRQLLANKVSIEGAVDVPGDYAITDGMRLSDLIDMARGPLDEAVLNQADLLRWNPDNSTTLIPVNLEKAIAKDPKFNLTLSRWDRVKVYTRQEVAWTGHRRVAVRGAVQRPGNYVRSENMRVIDLLRQVGGPAPDAHLDRAVLLHQRGDGTFQYEYFSIAEAQTGKQDQNLLVQDNDQMLVYKVGEAQFTPDHIVRVEGAVLAPGVYPRGSGMKLSELISLSGGFRPEAGGSVVVAHARKIIDVPDSIQKKITVAFNSGGQCAPEDDIILEDGDVVAVQGTGGFVDHVQRIYVRGAVNKPGPVVLSSKKMRLSDVIREAGGLRPEAFPEGAEFFRDPKMMASTGQRDLARTISELNNLLNDSEFRRLQAKSDIARIQAAGQASQDSSPLAIPGLGGSAPQANPAAALGANELYKRELVTKPRELTDEELDPSGAIAVNLPEALKKPSSEDDILLVDGDTVFVPETPTTVLVTGAVISRRGVLFKPGAKLDYYVQQAGGYAPDAAKTNIVVIRANSGTVPANKVRDLRPGDVILVPTRVLAAELKTKGNTFDSLFRSITSSFLVFRLFGL